MTWNATLFGHLTTNLFSVAKTTWTNSQSPGTTKIGNRREASSIGEGEGGVWNGHSRNGRYQEGINDGCQFKRVRNLFSLFRVWYTCYFKSVSDIWCWLAWLLVLWYQLLGNFEAFLNNSYLKKVTLLTFVFWWTRGKGMSLRRITASKLSLWK